MMAAMTTHVIEFANNCMDAITSAAARLGIEPATLAERCKDGEIAELVFAGRHAIRWGQSPAERSRHGSDCACVCCVAGTQLDDALKPFQKETP